MSVPPIPANCNTVNIYLVCKDAKAAIEFYVKAFGGSSDYIMKGPDGSVMHGEVRIGNSTVMISEENADWKMLSPNSLGGSPASIHLYVDDSDAVFANAIAAGCKEVQPMSDVFWGDRYGKVEDPFGYQWGIATHKEQLTHEQLDQRAAEFFAAMSGGEEAH